MFVDLFDASNVRHGGFATLVTIVIPDEWAGFETKLMIAMIIAGLTTLTSLTIQKLWHKLWGTDEVRRY